MKSQPTITFTQYITPFVNAYHMRTKRRDGLDIIRDTLAGYGVKRLSDIADADTEIACLTKIVYQLEHNT